MGEAGFLLPISVVLLGWVLAGGSPGPATLSISGTAMSEGRVSALLVAAGIVVGSATWGIAAALGFSAVMMANAWLFEMLRYAGAAYLLYLAVKSLRSAWTGGAVKPVAASKKALFRRGLLLHLTNPKAILSWGAIYAIVLAPDAGAGQVWQLFGILICASMLVFFGYAVLFSFAPVARAYAKSRRWFELGFGVLFGAASLKILTVKLT
ncbi:LysE family transporter [Lentibacter algarum]|uniref:LysE family translocator n=1 Tax=Lentibacter algarum TaxID=576131 RepID=UPI001C076ED1|nr:LysE family transporter [Lentibacter algarum]MBU2981739.1 LysE family transporter [Lentibacter algarum]